ncbi:ABC transporter ATP-binding protein [Fundicoccus culcitae]|uniref:ABC transporter ATP-binding protein n=1 Tax=Fundicoccus culcitae TaxID=2969821 RepID=A0ABY5P4N3_9LACT|nr:ABC transporter ATP-binding protein [Fundicoccus culcitae]UUX33716.1 ABC transporter ATP-binding protein [Fundicoccus culcitae]
MTRQKILEMRDLSISFKTNQGSVEAIRGVDLDLYRGETLAIVGESGSGKSVTVKTIMGILANNQRINTGVIDYSYEADGKVNSVDLLKISKKEMRRRFNGKRIAMVFQDPMTSLNPTMPIGEQIMEGMFIHYHTPKKEAREKALRLLELVGIPNGEERFGQYPHQLSGGMRQRVVIAIALACDPEILICDEPTTALDVTIQSKILDLINMIQKKNNIAVIYITHDLGVVSKVADYVNVMYAGRIVEKGSVNDIFYDPKHPYTWGLLSAMPDINTSSDKLYAIPGNPPNLAHHKQGDPFYIRNDYALNIDKRVEPPMYQISKTHYVASWLMHEKAPKVEMPTALRERIDQMKLEASQYERV